MSKAGWVAGSLAVVALSLGETAVAAEPHVRFRVQEPFRVGHHGFSGGVIALHGVKAFTPSRSVLKVWVNGKCLGIMTAERSRPESPPQRTEAVFDRDGDGRLAMVGFSVTGRPAGTTYRFR